MKCPKCGHDSDGRARFCAQCGASLRGRTIDAPPPIPAASRGQTSQHRAANKAQQGAKRRTPPVAEPVYDPGKPPPLRKKGCGFGSVLIALILLLGGGAAWFFTQQFRLERAAFERVRHSNSVAEIERYLSTRMYMPDEHRRAAEARIARLQSDSADFVNATTVEACERYLTRHSDGKHVGEVQSRLNQLRRSRPSIKEEVKPAIELSDTMSRTTASLAREDAAPQQKGRGRYHVVAASLANYDAATLRAASLRSKGYSAYVMEAASDDGKLYRVIVASYPDIESARNTANTVRRECPDAWILNK